MLNFFKKRKNTDELDIPPPPPLPGAPSFDIPEIRPSRMNFSEEPFPEEELPPPPFMAQPPLMPPPVKHEEMIMPPEPRPFPTFTPPPFSKAPKLPDVSLPKEPAKRETPPPAMAARKIIQQHEGPVYLRVDKYQAVLSSLDNIKESLNEVDMVIDRLNDLNAGEEKKFQDWQTKLESIRKKLAYIDNSVSEVA